MKARPRCDRWRALHHDVASDTWWRWMPAPDALWHIPRALARLARLQRREIERLRRVARYVAEEAAYAHNLLMGVNGMIGCDKTPEDYIDQAEEARRG